jgi:hypothetical protein
MVAEALEATAVVAPCPDLAIGACGNARDPGYARLSRDAATGGGGGG